MLFPEVCGATKTGTHQAAARPDGKERRGRDKGMNEREREREKL